MFRPGQKIRLFPEKPFPSPFGKVQLPEIELPPLNRPKLTKERMQVLRHTLGADAADIVGIIPFVGDSLSKNIESIHQQAMWSSLSEEEKALYFKYKKSAPLDSLAMVRTYVREDTGV